MDASEYSEAALAMVRTRPWPGGTVVRVLSAVVPELPPPPAPAWTGLTIGYKEFLDMKTQEAEALLGRASETLRTATSDMGAETVVRVGDPRKVIVDEAEEWSADLVVVGHRGLTGLTRLIMGSVAQYVVNHAPCSVEVVRAKAAP